MEGKKPGKKGACLLSLQNTDCILSPAAPSLTLTTHSPALPSDISKDFVESLPIISCCS